MDKQTKSSSQTLNESTDTSYISNTPNNVITEMSTKEDLILNRVVQQLKDLHNLINEAEFQANPDSRYLFNYQRLRYDLSLVVAGIEAHVNRPDYSPRSVETIPGNYR